MHKMGRKLMICAFFFRFAGRFSDGLAGLTGFSGSEEDQKILWGCMHGEVGGENTLYLGLLSYLMRLNWGLSLQDLHIALGILHLASMDT